MGVSGLVTTAAKLVKTRSFGVEFYLLHLWLWLYLIKMIFNWRKTKMRKLFLPMLALYLPLQSFAAQVKDAARVPIEIDLKQSVAAMSTCGFVSIDSLDFSGIDTSVPSINYETTVQVSADCSVVGAYLIYSDGATAYDIGNGAGIVFSNESGGAHANGPHPTTAEVFFGGFGAQTVTFFARLVDITNVSLTPPTEVTWTGSLPLTLEKQ